VECFFLSFVRAARVFPVLSLPAEFLRSTRRFFQDGHSSAFLSRKGRFVFFLPRNSAQLLRDTTAALFSRIGEFVFFFFSMVPFFPFFFFLFSFAAE